MVKPDYSRDYYADLELSATAEVTEIKKQFRKLALKYHPDRNPGEEDAAKAKFLIIQAAHEILTDATLKAKYDANRTRSKYPTASGVRGNPYSGVAKDATDQWGAPPKRQTGAQTRPASTRYSSWAPPPQPKPKQDSAYDHLRAWDRMRSAGHKAAAAATSAASAATGRASRPQPKADAPPPPPRTAYQARQQEASFGTRKTTGFAPTSPLGDEPPVKNQHYSSVHINVFEETAANLRKAKARAADPNIDPLSEQFGETFLDNRQRTPYASHVGEKTNPFEGASTTRARSVRESWRRTQESDDDRTPERPHRQRSASVGESESMKPTKDTPRAGYNAVPNLRFTSQAGARYSPRPAEPKTAPPTGAFPFPTSTSDTGSGYSSANATVNGGTSQTNGPNVYEPPQPRPWPLNYCFPSVLQQGTRTQSRSILNNGIGSFRTQSPGLRFTTAGQSGLLGPFPYQGSSGPTGGTNGCAEPDHDSSTPKKRKTSGTAPPSGATPSSKRMNPFERSLEAQLQTLLSRSREKAGTRPSLSTKGDGLKKANSTRSVRFTVPDDDDDDDVPPSAASQQARFMRNSTDNINTRFVAEEKAGESFMFNAGGPPSPEDAFMKAKQRSRSTPRGRQSPLRTAFASSTESFTNSANPPPKPSGFDAEEWTEKIGPHNFVPPQVTRTSASPTRQSRVPKKTKSVRMTAGTAGLVDDEHTSEEDRPRPTPSPVNVNGAPSPIPMDIDTPEPVSTPAPPQPSSARTINVEPSKPEWRAGDVNNTQGGARLENKTVPPKPNPNTAGSEDTDAFHRPIFADFQKVEPFAPKPSGLGNFGDMKTNLPFASKPSAKLPLQKEETTTKEVAVTLPPFPVCPRPPPALAVANLRPSTDSWREYVLNFYKYLEEWAKAEKKIHDHFAARDRKGESEGNQRFAWINTRSDIGCERYLRHLEEDKFIRQKWMAACEAHELHVRDFMRYREKMKQTVEMA
ncbi:hypothetical protein B0T14DRAFT_563557 [Immersiella caudata]|uniref:J domain-containing protein n=1 Tax=Immersiella caudata TaxID=314043 RepID=A0AA39X5P7_9PEZI|nr:hypothetical protein B0T14DRAFT_563557 [Immersiella caudata]